MMWGEIIKNILQFKALQSDVVSHLVLSDKHRGQVSSFSSLGLHTLLSCHS